MISRIQNPEDLQRIIMTIQEIMAEHFQEEGDGWNDLPPDAQTELREAIRESKSGDESLFTSHEEIMEKSRAWLKSSQ